MKISKYLVSDLDGTLIPWEGANRLGSFDSLKTLKREMGRHDLGMIYLTGRSFDNIKEAMNLYPLPEPEMIFSSAGSVLYKKEGNGWKSCINHQCYLEKNNPRWDRDEICNRMESLGDVRNQGEIHQSRYKLSFYVYSLDYKPVLKEAKEILGELGNTVSLQIYPEPDQGFCYLDLMARGADKKGALGYLKKRELHVPYVFAGDNWNDRSAFLSNHPSILVNNTPEIIKEETRRKKPGQFIARGRTPDRSGNFADGVLEGLEELGWVS